MGAGYAFGAVEGTILCIIGCVIGSALVFLFVRRFGVKLVEVFFPREKDTLAALFAGFPAAQPAHFHRLFHSGTPKDLLSYFIGLTDMNWAHGFSSPPWPIPSIVNLDRHRRPRWG